MEVKNQSIRNKNEKALHESFGVEMNNDARQDVVEDGHNNSHDLDSKVKQSSFGNESLVESKFNNQVE